MKLRRIDNYFRLYGGAVRLYRPPTLGNKGVPRKPSKRSVISSFSSHARLRLRESLAKYTLPGCVQYGLALSLPWRDLPDDTCAIYKRLFHLFGVKFRRSFPSSAAIFRHELQVRRAPHTHMVLYLGALDSQQNDVLLRDRICDLWLSALDVVGYYGGSRAHAYAHAVDLIRLQGCEAMFRYICDHTSKSKQAQLGYEGKQWGILNRSLLVGANVPLFRFPDEHGKVEFVRTITKLGRFNVRVPVSRKRDYFKPFRFKKTPRRKVSAIHFLGLSTSMRLAEYLGCTVCEEIFDSSPDVPPMTRRRGADISCASILQRGKQRGSEMAKPLKNGPLKDGKRGGTSRPPACEQLKLWEDSSPGNARSKGRKRERRSGRC